MILRRSTMTVAGVALLCAAAAQADVKKEETIKSLEKQTVEIRPGNVIRNSSDLARDNYREFLDLVTDDPSLSAEAMRRLGDLELEASEAAQLAENIEGLEQSSYDNAVSLYQRLLEAYPSYRRNDTVLYQLARAYEIGGRTDEALETLDELVTRYPATPMIGEVQFRRGEMLFLRKRYNEAEQAYQLSTFLFLLSFLPPPLSASLPIPSSFCFSFHFPTLPAAYLYFLLSPTLSSSPCSASLPFTFIFLFPFLSFSFPCLPSLSLLSLLPFSISPTLTFPTSTPRLFFFQNV